jgi:Leucine-rich repeat (LRR) protein
LSYYNGNCFPNWLSRDCHLVSLKLKSCELCSHFPPLGQFHCLKELSISHCYGIKINGEEEFYDNNNSTIHPLKVLYITNCRELKRVPPQHLPSLQQLTISNCYKLEECLCLEGSPSLEELYISHCSKLRRAPLPQHLPSLQKLRNDGGINSKGWEYHRVTSTTLWSDFGKWIVVWVEKVCPLWKLNALNVYFGRTTSLL